MLLDPWPTACTGLAASAALASVDVLDAWVRVGKADLARAERARLVFGAAAAGAGVVGSAGAAVTAVAPAPAAAMAAVVTTVMAGGVIRGAVVMASELLKK